MSESPRVRDDEDSEDDEAEARRSATVQQESSDDDAVLWSSVTPRMSATLQNEHLRPLPQNAIVKGTLWVMEARADGCVWERHLAVLPNHHAQASLYWFDEHRSVARGSIPLLHAVVDEQKEFEQRILTSRSSLPRAARELLGVLDPATFLLNAPGARDRNRTYELRAAGHQAKATWIRGIRCAAAGDGNALLKMGWLEKRGARNRQWRRRWFVLDPSRGELRYYHQPAPSEPVCRCSV